MKTNDVLNELDHKLDAIEDTSSKLINGLESLIKAFELWENSYKESGECHEPHCNTN